MSPKSALIGTRLPRLAVKRFDQPNLVLLRPAATGNGTGEDFHFGMLEDAFQHERGLIPKSGIHAVTLAKLNLKPGMTLWDLGAGSGAVVLEASALLAAGRIVTVEKEACIGGSDPRQCTALCGV